MSQQPELLQKERRDAVHWTRWAEVITPLYGKVRTLEVACDHPLDEVGWRTRTTKDKNLITCRDCHAIANGRPAR